MSFELFCKKLQAISDREGIPVSFSHEDGKHIARFSDGSLVMGNSINPSITFLDPYRNHCYQGVI